MGVDKETLLLSIMKDGVTRTVSMMQTVMVNVYGRGMRDAHVQRWLDRFDDPLYRLVVHEIGPDYYEYRLEKVDKQKQQNLI